MFFVFNSLCVIGCSLKISHVFEINSIQYYLGNTLSVDLLIKFRLSVIYKVKSARAVYLLDKNKTHKKSLKQQFPNVVAG